MFNIFKSNLQSKPQSEHLESAKQKLVALVAVHLKTLTLKRLAGISEDAYGTIDGSKWCAEMLYFLEKLFLPRLTAEEMQAVMSTGLSAIGQEFLETCVRLECGRMHDTGEYDMTVAIVHPPESSLKNAAASRPRSFKASPVPLGPVTRGLIIREDPLERILSGVKTWEMRGKSTKVRGTVALIKKGSKAVFGLADIVDSRGPLTRDEMLRSLRHHGIVEERLDSPELANYRFAWMLENVRRVPRQINYQHTGGVTFVTLDAFAVTELARYI